MDGRVMRITVLLFCISAFVLIVIYILISNSLRLGLHVSVLIIGGYNDKCVEDKFQRLLFKSKNVQQLKSRLLTQPRYSPIAAVLGRYLLISGGWNGTHPLGTTEIYGVSDLKKIITDYTFSPKFDACGGISGNKLYSCLGHNGKQFLDFCDVLSLEEDNETKLQLKYSHLKPFGISGRVTTCLVHKNHMVIIGGWLGDRKFTNNVYRVSLTNGKVTKLAPYPLLQHYLSSAVFYQGKIVVCGGKFVHYSNPYTNLCFKYDVVQNIWTKFPAMNSARAGHKLIVYKSGSILSIGGFNKDAFIESIEIYKNGNWTYHSVLPHALAKMGAVSSSNLDVM